MSFLFQTITITLKTTICILNGSIEEITLLKEKQVGLEYIYDVIRQHKTEQAALKFSNNYYNTNVKTHQKTHSPIQWHKCAARQLLDGSCYYNYIFSS